MLYMPRFDSSIVILGIGGLTGGLNGWAGMPIHNTGHEPGVLDIFSEYSFKIPRIYLNMLEYTRIYLIFPCRAGVEVLRARWAGAQTTLFVSCDFNLKCKNYSSF
jgi:hypothetical protein